jgi:hypothetical protein
LHAWRLFLVRGYQPVTCCVLHNLK